MDIPRPVSEKNNLFRYSSSEVVDFYSERISLFSAEKDLFAKYVMPETRLLDIGIGAGRTTRILKDTCKYVGIDWAPRMVSATLDANPEVNVSVGDATSLDFIDDSFDVVLFSFNGIDYVAPHRRSLVYQEVSRVLMPGGVFIFSSHNPRWVANPPVDTTWRVLLGWLRRLPMATGKAVSTKRFYTGTGSFMEPVPGDLSTVAVSPARVKKELQASGLDLIELLPNKSFGPFFNWFYYAARLGLL